MIRVIGSYCLRTIGFLKSDDQRRKGLPRRSRMLPDFHFTGPELPRGYSIFLARLGLHDAELVGETLVPLR